MRQLCVVVLVVVSLFSAGQAELKELSQSSYGPIPSKRSAYKTLRDTACHKEIYDYRRGRRARIEIGNKEKWFDNPIFNPPIGKAESERYAHAVRSLSPCLRAGFWYKKWHGRYFIPWIAPLCVKRPLATTSGDDPFYCKK